MEKIIGLINAPFTPFNADGSVTVAIADAKKAGTDAQAAAEAAQGAADKAQGDVDALAGKVGAVADGSTVVGLIDAVEDKADQGIRQAIYKQRRKRI